MKVNDSLKIKIPYKGGKEDSEKDSYFGTAKIQKIDLGDYGVKKIVADFNKYPDSLKDT
jgi:hypothetical protein